MMKKLLLIIVVITAFYSCSTLSGIFPASRLESAIPEEMNYTKGNTFAINDIQYLKEGAVNLPDQDSEWFGNTELPSMLCVLGSKYGLSIIAKNKGRADFRIDIWIHEMEKDNSIPRKNTLTVILTVSSNSGVSGQVVYIDETACSILNSTYAYKVFQSMLKKLAGALK